MTVIECRGYLAKVEIEDDLLFGRLLFSRDAVTFEAPSVSELKAEFERSLEDYLAVCKENGITPEEPASGKFQVRIAPELHRAARQLAALEHKSLNTWVEQAIAEKAAESKHEALA